MIRRRRAVSILNSLGRKPVPLSIQSVNLSCSHTVRVCLTKILDRTFLHLRSLVVRLNSDAIAKHCRRLSTMYCPICGEPFISQDDTLYCKRGDMPLSQEMLRQLQHQYSTPATEQSPLPAFSKQIHASLRWYCPSCGIRLNRELVCSQCRRHMRKHVWRLIELHPHFRSKP